MPRKKVNLSFIAGNKQREASYKKRSQTLKKSLSELTTLCGTEACLILYTNDNPEPNVWPSDNRAQEIISRFRNMADHEQTRKMENIESLMQKMVLKATKKMEKKMHENKRVEMKISMFKCLETQMVPNNLSMEDFNGLGDTIDSHLMEIEKQMEKMDRDEKEAHQKQATLVGEVGAARNKGKEPIVNDDSGLQYYP